MFVPFSVRKRLTPEDDSSPKGRPSSCLALLVTAGLMLGLVGCSESSNAPNAEGQATASPASESHAGHVHAAAVPVASTTPTCAAHDVPKTLCFICNADARDPGRLWCREHGRYEDRCWLCHPELQEVNRLYCDEHGLYEDECGYCHPELQTPQPAEAAPNASVARTVLYCSEHDLPEAECGICQPDTVAALRPGEGIKVRLPSRDTANLAGVEVGMPRLGSMVEGVECLAEISFNGNKLAQIVAPVGGIIQTVAVDLGSEVEADQKVAELWSASIAEGVAEAVLTHQTLDRERALRSENVTSQKELELAEATHRAACQKLRTLGFTEEQIDNFSQNPSEAVLLEVRAPFAGEIVQRDAVRGSLVSEGKPLFMITDRSVMWADLRIPETALAHVQVNQLVELAVDALPGRTFRGRLTWIAPSVNDTTRMISARAEIANPDGVLRDKMFARARILTRESDQAVLVPSAAIQKVEGQPLVFVELAADLFEARVVALGARSNGFQEIRAGLHPDERIVTQHGYSVKSQLLLSRLGAGCADE